MITTVKQYDQDAYATNFQATVLSCEKEENKKNILYKVILDQTLFFPEEGGQTPDKGTLNGLEVLDVKIKKDVITHVLAQPLEIGSTVSGIIDWTHRFSNMQQHTGEHIFSGLVHQKFGYDNVGFHLSDQVVTMDFNGVLSKEQILAIEYEVNRCISLNIPVEVTFPSKEMLADLDYRSKIEIEGQVRIVTIPGYDVCACCAPHVRQTGEIGLLKVVNLQNYKSGVRVSILCGFRALYDYRMKQENIEAISVGLSVKQECSADAVARLKEENGQLKAALAEARKKQMAEKIASLSPELNSICLFEEDVDADTMRFAVNELTLHHKGFCGIFVGNEERGYRYIIGSATKDCREMAALLREQFQAKGGGKPEMIQGSLSAEKAQILALFQ